ncbi:MAG TPA: hypothetical protein PLU30_27635 [Verrucomicrobiae bacterium]|nr:hypothetical protein [Verrucomicrobiae bacterium]
MKRQDVPKPSFLGMLLDSVSCAGIARKAMMYGALIAGLTSEAGASLMPLDDVHDSTFIPPVILKPASYGNLTGGDGDVSDPIWVASTDLGYLHFYNGTNAIPVKTVNTGVPDLSGVAYLGNNNYALSGGGNIYVGNVSGNTWTQTTLLPLDVLAITDIDFANNKYWISTADDIRLVNDDLSTTVIDPGGGQSLDILVFKDGVYTVNYNMAQGNAELFNRQDLNGNILHGAGNEALVDWNNSTTVRGIAYYDGGVAVIMNPGMQMHGEQAYQPNMLSGIPEPSALLVLAPLAVALMAKIHSKPKRELTDFSSDYFFRLML